MSRKNDTQQYKSLILGFCKCKNCNKEKFVWNTYFVCDECGSKNYEKIVADLDSYKEVGV